MSDRRLILARHGMSPLIGSSDRTRPLSDDGRLEAELLGQQLLELGWWPQIALVSDAQRTQETWETLLDASGASIDEVAILPDLYQASPERILAILEDVLGQQQTALVLAHNPGISEAASWASGIRIGMGTGNAALLHHPTMTDWTAVATTGGNWRLVDFLRPVPR